MRLVRQKLGPFAVMIFVLLIFIFYQYQYMSITRKQKVCTHPCCREVRESRELLELEKLEFTCESLELEGCEDRFQR